MKHSHENIVEFNKEAWNRQVRAGNEWTIPVSSEAVRKAKEGDWEVILTPLKPVPKDWFPKDRKAKVLGLASAGGQQGPLFAAAGYDVTIFDNSPDQLARDLEVASREGLSIKTVEGDMADLSCFADESFDFIFHPCSNCFVPDVNPVWREAYRVLRKGGTMISGFVNPVAFTIDTEKEKQGVVEMRFSIPYSDVKDLTEEERVRLFGADEPYTFGHSLDDLIGGQLKAGFRMTGFYEDSWTPENGAVHKYLNVFIATRVVK